MILPNQAPPIPRTLIAEAEKSGKNNGIEPSILGLLELPLMLLSLLGR